MPTPLGLVSVAFAPNVLYEHALRLITDFGFQPSLACVIDARMLIPELKAQPKWQPMGQKDKFIHDHRLLIESYLSSPSDWQEHFNALPDVVEVAFPGEILCPEVVYGIPPPGVALPLSAAQAGTYVRITFTHPMDNYDGALYAVSDLGLRLADPCYEQALSQYAAEAKLAQHSASKNLRDEQLLSQRENKETPEWHPMGQEHIFLTSHTLIVATSKRVTSNLWQDQLQALPGVVTIESPFTLEC